MTWRLNYEATRKSGDISHHSTLASAKRHAAKGGIVRRCDLRSLKAWAKSPKDYRRLLNVWRENDGANVGLWWLHTYHVLGLTMPHPRALLPVATGTSTDGGFHAFGLFSREQIILFRRFASPRLRRQMRSQLAEHETEREAIVWESRANPMRTLLAHADTVGQPGRLRCVRDDRRQQQARWQAYQDLLDKE